MKRLGLFHSGPQAPLAPGLPAPADLHFPCSLQGMTTGSAEIRETRLPGSGSPRIGSCDGLISQIPNRLPVILEVRKAILRRSAHSGGCVIYVLSFLARVEELPDRERRADSTQTPVRRARAKEPLEPETTGHLYQSICG
jgi:hypothetical protein